MGIFAKFNKEFAKWTTRTRPMGHVKGPLKHCYINDWTTGTRGPR